MRVRHRYLEVEAIEQDYDEQVPLKFIMEKMVVHGVKPWKTHG